MGRSSLHGSDGSHLLSSMHKSRFYVKEFPNAKTNTSNVSGIIFLPKIHQVSNLSDIGIKIHECPNCHAKVKMLKKKGN